jgi:hypothetical protein
MLSARQLLLMRRARDRAIDIDMAPLRTVVLLPDPDFRRCVLLDDLVGTQQDRRRYFHAECLGGLEIDRQFEIRSLLHRQIGGLRTPENFRNVRGGALRKCTWRAGDAAPQVQRCARGAA